MPILSTQSSRQDWVIAGNYIYIYIYSLPAAALRLLSHSGWGFLEGFRPEHTEGHKALGLWAARLGRVEQLVIHAGYRCREGGVGSQQGSSLAAPPATCLPRWGHSCPHPLLRTGLLQCSCHYNISTMLLWMTTKIKGQLKPSACTMPECCF